MKDWKKKTFRLFKHDLLHHPGGGTMQGQTESKVYILLHQMLERFLKCIGGYGRVL